MTKDEELAMDLALEALEFFKGLALSIEEIERAEEAITAIKQARSAPAQEPVFCEYCGGNDDADFGLPTEHCTDCARPQPAAQPAPVQEPVAFNAGVPPLYPEMKDGETISVEYATPPAAQRQWVGLTDEDKEFIELTGGKSDVMLAEMVEAKLRSKNDL